MTRERFNIPSVEILVSTLHLPNGESPSGRGGGKVAVRVARVDWIKRADATLARWAEHDRVAKEQGGKK